MILEKFRPTIPSILIAAVWLVNGFLCKVLGLVPRHEQIAARVLGLENAEWLIRLIGLSEIGMCLWVLSGIHRRLCGWTQIGMVALMNILEIWRAPSLLLFGPWNGAVAAAFLVFVFWEYHRIPKPRTL